MLKQGKKSLINFDFTTLLQTIDSARQKSVPSKPVEEGYAVTDVVNVPTKDKKKDKKVCTYVCTYIYIFPCTYMSSYKIL